MSVCIICPPLLPARPQVETYSLSGSLLSLGLA